MFTRLGQVNRVSRSMVEVPKRMGSSAKELKSRISACQNIKKITTSMKTVATAKVKKSEDQLALARAFSAAMVNFWPDAKQEIKPETNILMVPICADRGLCGAINSSIIKSVRTAVNKSVAAGNKNLSVLAIGDKGRSGLERVMGNYFYGVVADAMKPRRFNFKQASEVAQVILDIKFDAGEVTYNRFKNTVSFITTRVPIQSKEVSVNNTEALQAYTEQEGGNDILESLYEFRMGVRMYHWLAEADCSEISSRMTAMTNSSKSANEMIHDLSLKYNRRRQAKITTELMEIISGTMGLEAAQ